MLLYLAVCMYRMPVADKLSCRWVFSFFLLLVSPLLLYLSRPMGFGKFEEPLSGRLGINPHD